MHMGKEDLHPPVDAQPSFTITPKHSSKWLEHHMLGGVFSPSALDVMEGDIVQNAKEVFAHEQHALMGVKNIVGIVEEQPGFLHAAAASIGQRALLLRKGLDDPQMVLMSGLYFHEAFAQAEREAGASISPGKMLITETRRKMAEVLTRYAREKDIEDNLVIDNRVRTQPLQVDQITPDEKNQEILRLVVEGLSNKEIARHVDLSPSTIKNRLTKLLALLGVKNRTEAAVKVYELNK